MGDKFKKNGSGYTQNSEQQSCKVNCSCSPYDQDDSYPPNHPPPIPPPGGRDDLWDLQFCRWWGWNWVRKREAEATIVARYEEPYRTFPKQVPTQGYDSNTRQDRVGGFPSNSYENYGCASKYSGPPASAYTNYTVNTVNTVRNPAPSPDQCHSDNISKYSSSPINESNRPSKYSSHPSQYQPQYQPQRRQGRERKGSCCDGAGPKQYPPIPEDQPVHKSPTPSCGFLRKKKTIKPPKQVEENKDCLGHASLPSKKQFKEMCKCLLGKRQKIGCCKMAAMANLYKTPSGSRCTMERLAYGVADRTLMEQWPKCNVQRKRRTARRDRVCEDKCQPHSWPNVPEEQELQTTGSEEMINAVPLGAASGKCCPSTGESMEYLSVHLQHVQSDEGCECQHHNNNPSCGPTSQAASIHETARQGSRYDNQTQTHTPRDHKETQTTQSCTGTTKKVIQSREVVQQSREVVQPSREVVQPSREIVQPSREIVQPSREIVQPSREIVREPRELGKGRCTTQGRCATQGPCKAECKTYAEQMYNLNSSKHKTLCIRVCCCGNCKPVIMADGSADRLDSTSQVKHNSSKNVDKAGGCCDKSKKNNSTKEIPTTYPIIVPPSTTKMLSKFGTPSKNYPWLNDIGSDATTTTLNNNWETYKSPASGKTYDFKNIVEFDSRDSLTLPDLIDISEDLTYLKKIENSTNKSENESRLLLDAVCDAILHEHDERSLDILDELQTDSVNEALKRHYTELEILCDLTRRFRSKSDVHTELSRSYFANEDIGINTSVLKCDPDDNIKRMIRTIMENMSGVDIDLKSKVSAGINPEPVTETKKNAYLCAFKRDDDDVFTRTGLLPSKRSELNKKPSKREAPNSAKSENNSKKLKHEEEKKAKNEEEKKAKNEENLKNNRNTSGQSNERIGTIVSKIESIVKQNKVKNADIHKMLGYKLEKTATSDEINESLMGSVCFSPDSSVNETNKNKINKLENVDSNNSSKRIYKMSSDAFIGGISPFIAKTSEHKNMRCYDFFSDKLDDLQDYAKSCSGIASHIIFEEEIAKSSEDILCNGVIDHTKDSVSKKSLEKLSKLSVHSFVVCDQKSSVDQTPGCSGIVAKKEKFLKKKTIPSKVSLIPIRKQSSDGNISKPF